MRAASGRGTNRRMTGRSRAARAVSGPVCPGDGRRGGAGRGPGSKVRPGEVRMRLQRSSLREGLECRDAPHRAVAGADALPRQGHYRERSRAPQTRNWAKLGRIPWRLSEAASAAGPSVSAERRIGGGLDSTRDGGRACEVEFVDEGGQTPAPVIIGADDVRPLGAGEFLHAHRTAWTAVATRRFVHRPPTSRGTGGSRWPVRVPLRCVRAGAKAEAGGRVTPPLPRRGRSCRPPRPRSGTACACGK